MDILGADDMKFTMRIIAKYAQKKLETELKKRYDVNLPSGTAFIDYIHDDLRLCSNQAIRKIYKKLLEAGEAMPTQHHASMIVDLSSFFLWVVYKDTAYRDPLFWIINSVVDDPEFKKEIQPFVKNPKDWYCPQWIASKDETKKMQDEGLLPEFGLSPSEKRFVPKFQIDEIDAELRKQISREKMRNI